MVVAPLINFVKALKDKIVFAKQEGLNFLEKNEVVLPFYFEHNEVNIVYPWLDETARFGLSDS